MVAKAFSVELDFHNQLKPINAKVEETGALLVVLSNEIGLIEEDQSTGFD